MRLFIRRFSDLSLYKGFSFSKVKPKPVENDEDDHLDKEMDEFDDEFD